jgi:hypothetical protein
MNNFRLKYWLHLILVMSYKYSSIFLTVVVTLCDVSNGNLPSWTIIVLLLRHVGVQATRKCVGRTDRHDNIIPELSFKSTAMRMIRYFPITLCCSLHPELLESVHCRLLVQKLAPGYLVHSLKEYFIPKSIINHYQPIYDCSTALLENIWSSS